MLFCLSRLDDVVKNDMLARQGRKVTDLVPRITPATQIAVCPGFAPATCATLFAAGWRGLPLARHPCRSNRADVQ